MNAKFYAIVAGAIFVTADARAAAPSHKETATKVVNEIAGVKEKELVVIRGDLRDVELVEELALAVIRRGAKPLQMLDREQFRARYYKEIPEAMDSQSQDFLVKLAEMQHVFISIDSQEFPGQLKDVPPARLAAVDKSFQGVGEMRRKKNVRQIFLGNDLYPTNATAKRFGMSKDQLSKIFWAGVNVDYAKLQAAGEAVRTSLAGKELHVSNPNGTDLKVKIEARPIFVSDGVISAEDVKKGGPAVQTWLPAGEVYLSPVAGTAEGKLVLDRVPFEDGEIKGLTFTFQAGKATAITAKPSKAFDRWKALYDSAPAGKEMFSVFDVGINPAVTIPRGSKLLSFVSSGMVTCGIGDDTWAGGTNTVPFGFYGHLPGSTVTVDGKTVVEKGQLKVPAANPS